jgi:dolichol kinase
MFGLTMNDILATLFVFSYIVIIFLLVEKVWKGDKAVGRKILHISMGNIVFIIWLFDNVWTGILVASSFLLFSLIITQRMQLYFLSKLTFNTNKGRLLQKTYRKIITKLSLISASDAGNEFGLVYYCLSFTILAVLFFTNPVLIAVGILPLAYGDGMGAVIGRKYGKHKYKIIDKKSIEGSLAVFLATAIAVTAGTMFYGYPLMDALWRSCIIGLAVMIVEAVAPKGLDNLAIPLISVILFYFVLW